MYRPFLRTSYPGQRHGPPNSTVAGSLPSVANYPKICPIIGYTITETGLIIGHQATIGIAHFSVLSSQTGWLELKWAMRLRVTTTDVRGRPVLDTERRKEPLKANGDEDFRSLQRKYLMQCWAPQRNYDPIAVEKADGCRIHTTDDRSIFDLRSAHECINLGFRLPSAEIRDADSSSRLPCPASNTRPTPTVTDDRPRQNR